MPYEVLHFSGKQKSPRPQDCSCGLEQCLACHIGWLRHSHNLEN